MECLYCKSKDSLFGEITIKRLLPLAARGGSIKIGGQAITQIDMKNVWHQDGDGRPKEVLGPICCVECGETMHFVVGSSTPLRKGPVPEVET